MSQAQLTDSSLDGSANTQSGGDFERTCEELSLAIDKGRIGDIVAKHEKLILQYYKDVQKQANQSFDTARTAAKFGFWVLIATLFYVLVCDALGRFTLPFEMKAGSLAVTGVLGIVSGALMEFVAGVSFWLYSRVARQFGAFHICLERTHRYLLAYKIAEKIEEKKGETLQKLVCIMANAPMITRQDIEAADSGVVATQSTKAAVLTAESPTGLDMAATLSR